MTTNTNTALERTLDLLPCPFCGCQSVEASERQQAGHGESFTTYVVQCRACGASVTDGSYTGHVPDAFRWKVRTAWNRRTNHTPLAAPTDALDGNVAQPAPVNLRCKSEQKRLATLWGFVPAAVQAVQPTTVPPGYVLVPVQPDERIERAIAGSFAGTVSEARAAWSAGIAAAQSQAVPDGASSEDQPVGHVDGDGAVTWYAPIREGGSDLYAPPACNRVLPGKRAGKP